MLAEPGHSVGKLLERRLEFICDLGREDIARRQRTGSAEIIGTMLMQLNGRLHRL
jgi:hypothetical protein